MLKLKNMSLDSSVKNIVKLVGDPNAVKKTMNELLNNNDKFTFDTFAPMPTELIGTSPMQEVLPNKKYEETMIDIRGKMDMGLIHEHEVLPISLDTHKKLIHNYGYSNWYDWAMNHWGTKWGPYESGKLSDNEFSFYTVNATPHVAMVKMSMKYPKIEFRVRYADEDMGYNVGEYSLLNGETINTNVYREFNTESFLMAYNMFDDDYYLTDMIYELSLDEIKDAIDNLDNYLHTILLAILELEIVDEEYGITVNSFLLDKAVEYEQYEYAAKLKNTLEKICK